MCLHKPLDLATMLQFGSLDDDVEPRSCYDQTKAAASLLATHFHETRRPDIHIIQDDDVRVRTVRFRRTPPNYSMTFGAVLLVSTN